MVKDELQFSSVYKEALIQRCFFFEIIWRRSRPDVTHVDWQTWRNNLWAMYEEWMNEWVTSFCLVYFIRSTLDLPKMAWKCGPHLIIQSCCFFNGPQTDVPMMWPTLYWSLPSPAAHDRHDYCWLMKLYKIFFYFIFLLITILLWTFYLLNSCFIYFFICCIVVIATVDGTSLIPREFPSEN